MNLQRPNTRPKQPQEGKENEVKPQYEEQSNNSNQIMHAISQVMQMHEDLGTIPQPSSQQITPYQLSPSLDRQIKAKTTRKDLICQDTQENQFYSCLPARDLKPRGPDQLRKSQEPADAASQLLTLSDLLPTPNWYQNVGLEEGFPTEVPSLKSDQPISGNRKKSQSYSKVKPAQTSLLYQLRHTNQLRKYTVFNQHSARLTSSGTSTTHTQLGSLTNPVWSTVLRSAQTSPSFQLRYTDTKNHIAFPNRPALSIQHISKLNPACTTQETSKMFTSKLVSPKLAQRNGQAQSYILRPAHARSVTKLIPINPNPQAVTSLLITHQSALTISVYNHASDNVNMH
ncbi:putative lipid-A-disaccharide synthase, mitochondrial [Dorcoceras hygrometricum]|uniref:Putative lipid-A-disaccharide synthase, mitochondrial n=1 Tax=Dorcoceras hygrometricum TaxID=472368 RepID=A0A2Z7AW20_9LAMI|nr:putative lipid-A-disaccharide synthase, mitochondrial [Dorcoceras hygrometricum]